jgi:hypothetical protein
MERDDVQRHAFGGRLQFIAHFFSFQFDQRLAQFDEAAFALEPAHHADRGGVRAAGLGRSNLGGGGILPLARVSYGAAQSRGSIYPFATAVNRRALENAGIPTTIARRFAVQTTKAKEHPCPPNIAPTT